MVVLFFIFHEFQNKKDDGLSLLLNNLRGSNNVLITNDFIINNSRLFRDNLFGKMHRPRMFNGLAIELYTK